MKSIFKILFAAIISTCFFACNESALNDLTGKYPPPTEYTLTSLTSQSAVKHDNGTRTITLQFASTDAMLTVDFVVNAHFLKENGYTLAPATTAKNGNYTSAVFTKTGITEQQVTAGVIYVKLSGESDYTINATLQLADNSFIRVEFADVIAFEADPPAYTYSNEVQAPYAWTADGTNYTPVAGSQLNKITVSADGAPVAYFELVTTDSPASLSGTYPVSGEIRDANGAVVQGMYMDLSAFVPGLIIESGSYLLDGDVKQYISSGNLTIVDNGGVLTFSGSDFAVAVEGVAAGTKSINYPDATNGGGGAGTHTQLISASALDLSLFGMTGYTVTVKVATPELGVTVEQGAMGSTYTYTGSGQYISFDFSRDAGTLPEGVYNVTDNTAAQVNDCLAGYPSLFGAGYMGTFVGNVADGATTEEIVTGGTVTVTANGFEFNLTTANGTITGNYAGAIAL